MNSDFQKSEILKFNFLGRFKIHKFTNHNNEHFECFLNYPIFSGSVRKCITFHAQGLKNNT